MLPPLHHRPDFGIIESLLPEQFGGEAAGVGIFAIGFPEPIASPACPT